MSFPVVPCAPLAHLPTALSEATEGANNAALSLASEHRIPPIVLCNLPKSTRRGPPDPKPQPLTPPPLQLSEAYEWLMKYKASRKEAELHQVGGATEGAGVATRTATHPNCVLSCIRCLCPHAFRCA